MNKKAICPTCDKVAELNASNSYRPFCSIRCKLIDLGEWVNEGYSITDTTENTNNIDPDISQKH
jgi:uncharacterized protein